MSSSIAQTEAHWSTWRSAAESVAVEAGRLIRTLLNRPLQVTEKGFRDLVTDADLAAQQQITDSIRARFPDHSFLVEEKDSHLPSHGPVRWIVDPIDGTSNYSRGLPVFCVSVAVAVEETVVAGAIYDPMREELFSGGRGQGSALNGQPLQVRPTQGLDAATIAIDWGRRYEIRQGSLEMLLRFAHGVRGIRSVGSAALALAWVAAGRLDAYVNLNLSAWDIAAGALLVHEAGGLATTLASEPLALMENTSCLGTNGLIHQAFQALIHSGGS